eukprot:9067743-Pyramimonas_sp.AAC.1
MSAKPDEYLERRWRRRRRRRRKRRRRRVSRFCLFFRLCPWGRVRLGPPRAAAAAGGDRGDAAQM